MGMESADYELVGDFDFEGRLRALILVLIAGRRIFNELKLVVFTGNYAVRNVHRYDSKFHSTADSLSKSRSPSKRLPLIASSCPGNVILSSEYSKEEFSDEHERLFAEAQKTREHGPVTSHYYSVMSKVIDEYFNGNFHFVPPLKEDQTLEDALRSLHLRIADELRLGPGLHCLDVGCGIGTVIGEVASTGAQFTGVTIAANEVQIGNANFEKAGINDRCRLIEADCKEMPMEENTFDCAYAIYSLKYLVDLTPVLDEISRVLKPGGRFVIYDLIKTNKFNSECAEHTKVVSALEYACGMPPLHWRSEMIEKATAVGLKLVGSTDLAEETGCPFHFSFSHSSTFMWLINSGSVGGLIKMGQALKLLPNGFHRFNKTFLAGTVLNIVKAGEMGVVSGAEILVFEKCST